MDVLQMGQIILFLGVAAACVKAGKQLSRRQGRLVAILGAVGSAVLTVAINFWQYADRITAMPVAQAVGVFVASVAILGSCLAVPMLVLLHSSRRSVK